MLIKFLKAIIVVAIISRTLLLLDNYGQNPDTQEYKGKKFTNFSTLVLAYIVTHMSKDGIIKSPFDPNGMRLIIALSIVLLFIQFLIRYGKKQQTQLLLLLQY